MIVHNHSLFSELTGTSNGNVGGTRPPSGYSVDSRVSDRFHGTLYFPELKVRKRAAPHHIRERGGCSTTCSSSSSMSSNDKIERTPSPPAASTKSSTYGGKRGRQIREAAGLLSNPAVSSAPVSRSIQIDPGYISKEVDQIRNLRHGYHKRKLVVKRKAALENNRYLARVKQITEKHSRNLQRLGAIVVDQELELNLEKVLKANRRVHVKNKQYLNQKLKYTRLIDQQEKCSIRHLRQNARRAIENENRRVNLAVQHQVRTEVMKQQVGKLVEDRTRAMHVKIRAEQQRINNIETERSRLRRRYQEEKRKILLELTEAEVSRTKPPKNLGNTILDLERVWHESLEEQINPQSSIDRVHNRNNHTVTFAPSKSITTTHGKKQSNWDTSTTNSSDQNYEMNSKLHSQNCHTDKNNIEYSEKHVTNISEQNVENINNTRNAIQPNNSHVSQTSLAPNTNIRNSDVSQVRLQRHRILPHTAEEVQQHSYVGPGQYISSEPSRDRTIPNIQQQKRWTSSAQSANDYAASTAHNCNSSTSIASSGSNATTASIESCPGQLSQWQYVDNNGRLQGPFTSTQMRTWHLAGYFTPNLHAQWRRGNNIEFNPLVPLEQHFVQIPKSDWFA